ncbi:VOC family protein [Burkholderiaceae bacterium DAT-1]|nr:VOC family protein [Burkholderiaceae bacterium DAT-1]
MTIFSIQRIDHVVLRVASLDASISFYQKVLGCTVVRRRDDLGLIHLAAGESMIDLVSLHGPIGKRGGAAAGVEARNMDHLCLRVEPFDEPELVQFLLKQGVHPLGAAEINFGAEGDGLSLYIHDPDGNLVELKGPSNTG